MPLRSGAPIVDDTPRAPPSGANTMTTRLSRGLCLLVVLSLPVFAGVGCTAGPAGYPEAGEPGPVVTADGETIPEGPARDTFMAGYDAGFKRSAESGGSYMLRTLGGAAGGIVAASNLPVLLSGWILAAPTVALGVGVVTAAVLVGPTPPLTPLPASVVEQGPLYADGYREGYIRGVQEKRRFAAIGGALLGTGAGIALLFALLPST